MGSYSVQISSEQREHREQENRPLIRGPRSRGKSGNEPKAIQTPLSNTATAKCEQSALLPLLLVDLPLDPGPSR